MSAEARAYLGLFSALAIFAVLYTLGVILCREKVKNDLRDRCLRPLSVRWRPLAWWGSFYGSSFVVRYLDLQDSIHEARCWTDSLCPVVWSSDEIVSR